MSSIAGGDDPRLARVVADAQRRDAGLPAVLARELAGEALALIDGGVDDTAELARRLLASHPDAGASAAGVVAVAAAGPVSG